MITVPCKDCPERHPCCWDTCERYMEYKRVKKEYDKEMRDMHSVCRANKMDRQRTRKLGGRSLWA